MTNRQKASGILTSLRQCGLFDWRIQDTISLMTKKEKQSTLRALAEWMEGN